jgi:hypothetical protein
MPQGRRSPPAHAEFLIEQAAPPQPAVQVRGILRAESPHPVHRPFRKGRLRGGVEGCNPDERASLRIGLAGPFKRFHRVHQVRGRQIPGQLFGPGDSVLQPKPHIPPPIGGQAVFQGAVEPEPDGRPIGFERGRKPVPRLKCGEAIVHGGTDGGQKVRSLPGQLRFPGGFRQRLHQEFHQAKQFLRFRHRRAEKLGQAVERIVPARAAARIPSQLSTGIDVTTFSMEQPMLTVGGAPKASWRSGVDQNRFIERSRMRLTILRGVGGGAVDVDISEPERVDIRRFGAFHRPHHIGPL